jgi:outer membrane protein OmpA-like peptidoglycan-associated protein
MLAGLTFIVAGCAATAPPPELMAARVAYTRASQGVAAQATPDELHKARTALDTAESAFAKEPKAQSTRDLAYIAERKAELAEAKGQAAVAGREKASSDKEYTKGLATKQQATQQELDATRLQAANDSKSAADKLSAEQMARAAAEEKSAQAMRDLAKIAQMREEERGTIISLSGDVLFVTNGSVLLPGAQNRLNQLADALNGTVKHMIIEGHTDSRGTDAFNQDLSFRRATAVRDYLVGRNVVSERIRVQGFGKTKPIGDNNTAEGRAMNRRVEIVIEGKQTANN